VECAIVGRFSYDNIIERIFGPIYMRSTASESKKCRGTSREVNGGQAEEMERAKQE
jgi:hypothetical protein